MSVPFEQDFMGREVFNDRSSCDSSWHNWLINVLDGEQRWSNGRRCSTVESIACSSTSFDFGSSICLQREGGLSESLVRNWAVTLASTCNTSGNSLVEALEVSDCNLVGSHGVSAIVSDFSPRENNVTSNQAHCWSSKSAWRFNTLTKGRVWVGTIATSVLGTDSECVS